MDQPISNRDKTVSISKSIETGDRYPWSHIDSRRYVQHNVNLTDGLGGILAFVDSLPPGTSRVRPVRAFEDGDLSFSHLEYYLEPYGPAAGFEVHRWEDGRIVEHWDNLQAIPATANPSGRSMFDGTTEIEDLDRTEANKTRAAAFVRDVLIAGDDTRLAEYLADDHVSHRPDYGDGPGELSRQLRDAGTGGLRHLALHRVLGEGNFVLTLSEGTRGGEDVAIFDLIRLADDRIAEHWDVVEVIPPRDQWRNDNGKF